MSEIRNLTRNGETFYPLTCSDAVLNRDGEPLGIVNDIFDISEYNASGTPPVLAKYASLSLALAAVPSSKQKGGMTIRYVPTSDNKYVQYRLTKTIWSAETSDWQSMNADDKPTRGSDNLANSGGVAFELDNIKENISTGTSHEVFNVESGGIDNQGGVLPVDPSNYGKYAITDFIDLSQYTSISINALSGTSPTLIVYYYDAEKVFIYGSKQNVTQGYEVDLTKPYCRFFGAEYGKHALELMPDWIDAVKKDSMYPVYEKLNDNTGFVNQVIKNVGTVNITLEEDIKSLNSLKIYGKTIQSGTDKPSPSNNRPFTGIGVYDSGTNKYVVSVSITDSNGTQSLSISLDEPLYNGDWVDIITGVLHKETFSLKITKDSSITIQAVTSRKNRFYVTAPSMASYDNGYGFCNELYPSKWPVASPYNNNTICGTTTVARVYFVIDDYSTVEALKLWLENNPITFVGYRAVAVESEITIPKIDDLIGTVTITCSGAMVGVGYWELTENYVHRKQKGVTVGTGGDYSTLLKALKCTENDIPITVLLGEHDIMADYEDFYGSNFWDAYDNEAGLYDPFLYGLWVTGGREITFSAGSVIKANYTGNNEQVVEYFSAFATGMGVTLKNMQLEVHNIRYAIHDDFSGTVQGINCFEGCIFKGYPDRRTMIGGGCGTNGTYIVKDCLFIFDEGAYVVSCISYHNNKTGVDAQNRIIVNGCNGNGTCKFYWYGVSEKITYCSVSSCKFTDIGIEAHSMEPHAVENMVLYEWNNIVTI